MLAGCSSALLTQRHRLRSDDASAPFQACHFQLQDKMSAQQFNLPCSFSRKDPARVSLSLDKPAEARSTCSFRQNAIAPSSASLVAQTASWESRREVEGDDGFWDRGKSLKRCYERSSSEDSTCMDRSKRKRTTGNEAWLVCGGGGGGAGEEFWFPRSNNEPSFVGEEKVCFVPNAANAFLGALGMEMVGEMDVGTSGGAHEKPNPDSSSSSDSHGSSPKLNEDSSENESGNGAQVPNPSGGVPGAATAAENSQTEQQGLELVSLLTDCVEAISSSNHTTINYYLARLGELATPTGSPVHRLAAYFTEALALRAAKLWPHIFFVAPPRELADQLVDDEEDATSFRLLNHVSPIPKFLHFTLNERLLRAFEGKDRVHIIDFDIKQGLQWPGLFQSLASRPNPPSHVRITGIGESKQDLQDTGARLAGFAESLHLPFEFHPVVDRLEDVRLWMLHVKERECVAVNCVLQLHKALYDENRAAFMDFLGLIRSTNPAIVLVAEQEAEHNEPMWETRFANSLRYYAAIFDSLDFSLPVDSPARIKIEEMFARKLRNIVACEGNERVERHETFSKWRSFMEDGGYRCLGFGERETLQSRMLLRMYSSEKYSVEKQGDVGDAGDAAGLTLKWLEQPLYTVSAWAPLDIAGSSSTSQPATSCIIVFKFPIWLSERGSKAPSCTPPKGCVRMGVLLETRGKQQQVDVHYVNAPVSCVVEEDYLPLPEVLQEQETVYQSSQRDAHMAKASSSNDTNYSQSRGEGSSSGSVDVEEQLAMDEAFARQLQEMEDQFAGVSLSEINATESDISSNNSSTSAAGGQDTSNTSDQVASQDDVDPDNMTYEQLQSLGEAIGTESRGLSDELIGYLPSSTYRTGFFSRKEKQECVICCMAYKNKDALITLPCQHNYHSSCVTRWLKINKACPICNEDVFG
ncbi:hypothetical protein J5N97_019080 [Dioscorea zingiberensis]|uniref:RING-type domain-containing protein n=1 Tax=Dioscorea zingiberensis TaxID=325984 RepID=A0A9D5CDA1_9LILI|nr:hypothetical protein J5N97_019080 [Dioscorea zingiberensis]